MRVGGAGEMASGLSSGGLGTPVELLREIRLCAETLPRLLVAPSGVRGGLFDLYTSGSG